MSYTSAVIAAAVLLVSLSTNALAGELSGAQEYKDNCARCHGPDGRGNGPDANEKPGYHPADLTQIAKRRGGRFPRQRIYEIIDGGNRTPGHYNFNSPMPLWGLSFQVEGKQYTQASEAVVRQRINTLLNYLESIQKSK